MGLSQQKDLDKIASNYDVLLAKLAKAASSLNEAASLVNQVKPDQINSVRTAASQQFKDLTKKLLVISKTVSLIRESVKTSDDTISEQERKEQDEISEKLLECVSDLISASKTAFDMGGIVKTSAALEVSADRRLRIKDIIRTVNTAKHHISRVHMTSSSLSKNMKDFLNTLDSETPDRF